MCKNNIKLIYLNFRHCTCKFGKHKQFFLSEKHNQSFHSKNYTHYSCPILKKLQFFSIVFFSENAQILNFIKILPVGAELFHADQQTDGQTNGQT